jgi:anti-sigma regulatory factor (Ser/Thr protein kinase)
MPRLWTEHFGLDPRELLHLELAIRDINFLSPEEKSRITIIATEILDNIITHSQGLKDGIVLARLRKGTIITLSFWFKSENFATFAANEREAECRYFDKTTNRYRGLGLSMCRNLSKSIDFHAGKLFDSIVVIV